VNNDAACRANCSHCDALHCSTKSLAMGMHAVLWGVIASSEAEIPQ